MATLLWFLVVLACGYGAYRAFRGGFQRSQSDKLNVYGIIGCIVLLIIAASVATKLLG
ncbi:MAG: hypothetical protein AB1490_18920 [Pseudomonadota bacterium]